MISKSYLTRLFAIFFLLFGKYIVNGQVPILDINFDGYNGTAATVPAGIFISWNSASPASFYTSAGNYGSGSPSYKFGNDSDYIVTKLMSPIDSISFWMKGNGSPFSPLNELRFYFSADSLNYVLFESLDSLPTSGGNFSFSGNQVTGYIKIEYYKTPAGGNLAFDDLKIYSSVAIGMNDIVSADEMIIYPTPTNGLVNIKTQPGSGYPVVEVYDIIGNKVPFGTIERMGPGHYTFDIKNRNKGFYFVKIKSGYQFVTRRITLID